MPSELSANACPFVCSSGGRDAAFPSDCLSLTAFQLALLARQEKKGSPSVACEEMQPSKLESVEGLLQGPPLGLGLGKEGAECPARQEDFPSSTGQWS